MTIKSADVNISADRHWPKKEQENQMMGTVHHTVGASVLVGDEMPIADLLHKGRAENEIARALNIDPIQLRTKIFSIARKLHVLNLDDDETKQGIARWYGEHLEHAGETGERPDPGASSAGDEALDEMHPQELERLIEKIAGLKPAMFRFVEHFISYGGTYSEIVQRSKNAADSFARLFKRIGFDKNSLPDRNISLIRGAFPHAKGLRTISAVDELVARTPAKKREKKPIVSKKSTSRTAEDEVRIIRELFVKLVAMELDIENLLHRVRCGRLLAARLARIASIEDRLKKE